jgi:putative ABC transport system substrate-binding protein
MSAQRHVVAVLALLAAASVAATALAQPAERKPRIGVLIGRDTPANDGFRRGMSDLGYVEGGNIVVETRHAGGRMERLPELAAELVQLDVDLICALSGQSASAARRATSQVPIVFNMLGDPVAAGWVASYARPGGNLTGLVGLSPELAAKRLELLREVAPHAARIALLANPSNPIQERGESAAKAAAQRLGVEVQIFEAGRPDAIEGAFAKMTAARASALMVLQDIMFATQPQRGAILRLAAEARLPAVYVESDWVPAGGLMSYAPSLYDMGRRAATYVDKILKGAKPADLPVEQPTRFELVVNLKTAKALGIEIPRTILERADEVIE